MKKLVLLALPLLWNATAALAQTQTQNLNNELRLKPGPEEGEDAILMNTNGCLPDGYPGIPENLTGGNGPEIQIADWTFGSCGEGTLRSLIRFRSMNNIPANAIVTNATLKLFGIPYGLNPPGNNNYPGSPYPLSNEVWVQRVTSNWAEGSVTWNTQPTATSTNQTAIGATNLQWNYNTTVDVTQLVNDIRNSGSNWGFKLLLQNEAYYRSQYYATSDYGDSSKWPELVIQYSLPAGIASVTSNPLSITSVSPNPAQGSWKATVLSAAATKADVVLYDFTGRLLQSQTVNLNAGENSLPVSGQNLPAGSYLLRVVTKGAKQSLQAALVKY